jgi:hypothetical protein
MVGDGIYIKRCQKKAKEPSFEQQNIYNYEGQ